MRAATCRRSRLSGSGGSAVGVWAVRSRQGQCRPWLRTRGAPSPPLLNEVEIVNANQQRTKDPITEGAHARALGRPKDACPYPADSRERRQWLDGYDGTPSETRPDPSATKG